MDWSGLLARDWLVLVFRRLSPWQVVKCRSVCKLWARVGSEPCVWEGGKSPFLSLFCNELTLYGFVQGL